MVAKTILIALPFFAAYAVAAADLPADMEGKGDPNSRFPVRPVRFIVPFPPGGSDTVARIVGQKLTERVGQQFVIDNRAGAGGIVGTEMASKAAPDGYTILFATSAFAIGAVIYKKLPYDSLRDFAPIGSIASAPLVLVVHPSVPANSAKDLIALAKAKPGGLNYASNGSGSITSLSVEMLKSMAGISVTEVTYKGAGPSLTALLAGEVQLMIAPLGPSMPYIRSGRLRAIGMPSPQRSALLPELPTIAESAIPKYESVNWYGVFAPRETPVSIRRALNRHIVALLEKPDVIERFTALGYESTPSTPEQFGAFVESEMVKWGKVIREAKIAQE